ncbi:MAG: polyphosphate kinase 1 [Treponema sp.]|jgi:polyphosphate kinase|nr:polyphosphate kinase 1 [Treponema sp.]
MYLNRDLSWIEFNRRVLAEGLRGDLPPLEKFRFLSIVSSNFDEFFMVRMAALKRSLESGKAEDPSGLSPAEQISAAAAMIRPMLCELYRCLENEIFPALEKGGLPLIRPPFQDKDGDYAFSYIVREVLPVLTPLRFGSPKPPGSPAASGGQENIPVIANGMLYGAFLISRETAAGPDPASSAGLFPAGPDSAIPAAPGERPSPAERHVAVVQIPPVLDRMIPLPGRQNGEELRWVLLDDLVLLYGGVLFKGYAVEERMIFRVHRDADFSVDEKRDEDFIEAMEEVIAGREHSPVIRMVYSENSRFQKKSFEANILKETIAFRLDLGENDLYPVDGPLNLGSLWSLVRVPGFDRLKVKQKQHYPHPAFPADRSVWDCVRGGDILLALPYHSFDPVVRFFREAAEDPQVISIKTALYRTSGDSPVIQALEKAALNGKHVTAIVELKARFDEERNISWAARLEKAGVIVIYGIAQLKVHAKISQVIRREPGGLARYIHLSTGNYNDRTARQYSDLSLFTVNEDFGNDATVFFNTLSGYSALYSMSRLVMAPWFLKRKFLDLIERETRRAKEGAAGKISAKMNALVDSDVVDALYKASRAGVKVRLNVRGICTLVPGVKGVSENITVTSIVDHYLEHSRIFCFNNGGAEEFYISSADWMPRNLERRVELLIPVLDTAVKEEIREILDCYFKDTSRAWILGQDGTWSKRPQTKKPFEAQARLLALAAKKAEQPRKARQELVVRRGARVEQK